MRKTPFSPGAYQHRFTMAFKMEGNLAVLIPTITDRELSLPGFAWALDESLRSSLVAQIPDGIVWPEGKIRNCHFIPLSAPGPQNAMIQVEGLLDYEPRQDYVRTLLNSWRLKFLGHAKLNRLYHYFGEDAFVMIEHCPEIVRKKLFLDQRTLDRLYSETLYLKSNFHGINYLIEKGMEPAEIDLIIDMFAGSKGNDVDFNPFMLLKRRRGSPAFEKRFFDAMGIPHLLETDPGKVVAMYMEMMLSTTGDTALEYDVAVDACARGLNIPKIKSETIIRNMIADGSALFRKMWGLELISAGKMLTTDREISKGLGDRTENPQDEVWVDHFETQSNSQGREIALSDEQKMAIQVGLTSKTSVITGGPGTGKTTITQTLIREIRKSSPSGRILLACPTGKAARRMTEATGEVATTLHRLMGMTPDSSSMMSRFDESDTLILDEASMMDIHLLAAAIRHTHGRGRVILIGDPDQIPSIENGSILTDIILSRHVAVSLLTKPQRFASESDIENAAYSIINGEMPRSINKRDFHFIEVDEDKSDICQVIRNLVVNEIPERYGIDTNGVQILSAMHKGIAGVNNLNEKLKASFNPASVDPNTDYRVLGNQIYHVGDRVMQLKNRYDLDIQNGETGVVDGFDDKKRRLLLRMDDQRIVRLPYENYPFMMHAWSSTIHKSQGSEYDCVIIALSRDHDYMLNRKLLYTAVTRGKKMVFVVGSKDVLEKTIKKKMRTIPSSSPLAKNIERLTILPYMIADELCLNTPNDIFKKMAINSNKYHNLPEKKHTIDLDNIVLPF